MSKKIIKIIDYSNSGKEITINNFEDVIRLKIEVITGDEILHVLRKDYSEEIYDSCCYRMQDYFDDEYIIYDTTQGIDVIDKWNKRNDSYDIHIKEWNNEYK